MDCASNPLTPKVVPREGDVSVCLMCGHITRFARDMKLIEISPDERRQILLSNPKIGALLKTREHVVGGSKMSGFDIFPMGFLNDLYDKVKAAGPEGLPLEDLDEEEMLGAGYLTGMKKFEVDLDGPVPQRIRAI